jgi:hypothetical protein
MLMLCRVTAGAEAIVTLIVQLWLVVSSSAVTVNVQDTPPSLVVGVETVAPLSAVVITMFPADGSEAVCGSSTEYAVPLAAAVSPLTVTLATPALVDGVYAV